MVDLGLGKGLTTPHESDFETKALKKSHAIDFWHKANYPSQKHPQHETAQSKSKKNENIKNSSHGDPSNLLFERSVEADPSLKLSFFQNRDTRLYVAKFVLGFCDRNSKQIWILTIVMKDVLCVREQMMIPYAAGF